MIFSFFAFMYLGHKCAFVHLIKNVVSFCGFHLFVSFCDYHIINSNYPQKKLVIATKLLVNNITR